MFQFRAFPTYTYLIQCTLLEYCSSGFPHSEISGSTDICSSPKLIAACHVLRRLLMPRHSPCALYSLTSSVRIALRALLTNSRLRDSVLLNYAGNHRFTQNCYCYPHLSRCCPQLNQLSFLSSLLERPLCCLAFITLIHCSVFKVQSLSFVKVRNKYSISLNTYFRAYLRLVGPSGLEPPTLRLSVVRSSQLSYGPLFSLVEIVGIEPATSCLQGRRSPS